MTALKERSVSAVEYLAMDRDSEVRLEFIDGEVFPIEAVTRAHSSIATNITGMLYAKLRGKPCGAHAQGLRVMPSKGRNYFYPDVVVACGELEFVDRMGETLIDATVIFEVLSKSTELRDRKIKFESYWELPSLQHYVLVDQYRPRIELFERNKNGTWTYSVLTGLEAVLSLPRIGCELPLTEIYERVTFPTLNEDNEPLEESAE